jgi:primosomal protein N' (replication factor Y)
MRNMKNTYKQFDPSPRYHARDVAIVLAEMHGAKVLLGSATPSLESYFNAKLGKFGFVELFQRHLDIKLPEIEVVNTIEARRKKNK